MEKSTPFQSQIINAVNQTVFSLDRLTEQGDKGDAEAEAEAEAEDQGLPFLWSWLLGCLVRSFTSGTAWTVYLSFIQNLSR